MAQSKPTHIGALKPLPQNPRRHNPRNIGMIVDSLQEVGAARSIVIDEENFILAGNGTVEAAAEAGITKVKVIEVDGETIVAVRRTDLTEEQKARLAILDNRANETSDWDPGVLAALQSEGVKLEDLWREDELAELLKSTSGTAPDVKFPEHDEKAADDVKHVQCPECGHRFPV